jgi:hypothetical protein
MNEELTRLRTGSPVPAAVGRAQEPAPAPVKITAATSARPALTLTADATPQTANQFLLWLRKQTEEGKQAVKAIVDEHNLPTLYKTWDNRTVADMVRALTSPDSAGPQRSRSSG